MKTYEKIHKEFNDSLEISVKALDDIINNRPKVKDSEGYNVLQKNHNLYNTLKTAGFVNSKTKKAVDTVRNIDSKVDNIKDIRSLYNHFSTIMPYKIISYSQVITILEKYNLYLGNTTLFTGDIPEKNLNDISNYFTNIDKLKINDFRLSYYNKEPIFKQIRRFSYYGDEVLDSKFMICAPKSDFQKDLVCVGRELINYEKPKFKLELSSPKLEIQDPVVLNVIPELSLRMKQPVFYIVTSWGPESSDILILNEKMN